MKTQLKRSASGRPTGEGLAGALAGAQVVVDVANSPSFEDKAVLEFLETSQRISHSGPMEVARSLLRSSLCPAQ
ncbi:hypothetical protein [Leptolyngbya sp. FACHB-261]|uniref:hypothetical protein n=1 Tax=Leptolyngbya sp. FACHB-261 TaxID=2692806 RepID=UPI0018EFD873|nr:hypothetical protein [Leptolyngbya sp. FACHB-261]